MEQNINIRAGKHFWFEIVLKVFWGCFYVLVYNEVRTEDYDPGKTTYTQ